MKPCSVVGCPNPFVAKGHCSRHYLQMKRKGFIKDRAPVAKTLESLLSNTDRIGGCRIWTRSCTTSGYGVVWDGGKQHLAHRLSFTLATGIVIDRRPVHHKCGNTKCIEPDHLQLATDASNNLEMLARKGYEAEIEMLKNEVTELRYRLSVYEGVN